MSLSLTKQGMWLALEIPSFDAMIEMENRQQILTAQTADAGEAMAAYVGKRGAGVREQVSSRTGRARAAAHETCLPRPVYSALGCFGAG